MAPGDTNRDDNDDDDVDNNDDNRNQKNYCQVKLINKLNFSCPQGKTGILCFHFLLCHSADTQRNMNFLCTSKSGLMVPLENETSFVRLFV